MPGYKLSQEADEDIQNILRYGIINFGVAQALKYHSELETRFELLAQFSRIGTPVYDLRPGLRSPPQGPHNFLYHRRGNFYLARLLVATADFKRHF